jgi:hypothetical protein
MATAALIVSLVGIIVPFMLVLGLIFGLIGLSRSRETGSGRGQSIAATVVSAVFILGWAVIIAILANVTSTRGAGGAPSFRDAHVSVSAVYWTG